MEFVLSDESPDRLGDIIMSDGWDLRAFARNPIALWAHRSDQPIGRWANLRVENKSLRGHLALAPAGTSARIDEIRKLVEAGILKAVSVGFRSIEDELLDKKNPFSGMRFLKQELIECSLVSIPANPNALAVAKSLKISPQTLPHERAAQCRSLTSSPQPRPRSSSCGTKSQSFGRTPTRRTSATRPWK